MVRCKQWMGYLWPVNVLISSERTCCISVIIGLRLLQCSEFLSLLLLSLFSLIIMPPKDPVLSLKALSTNNPLGSGEDFI